MRRYHKIIILLLVLYTATRPLAGLAQLSDSATVSLITCRPGDEIYNAFGHTAIRVKDPANQLDILFNYGMFSFSEPNFLPKFLRGKLMYWLGTEKFKAFIDNYSNQKRSVIEQELNLDQSQKNQIFQALRQNLKAENRRYLYDFFFDNCSTRPRDILIQSIDGISFDQSQATAISFRHLLDGYTYSKCWTDFGIDLIIGSIADRKASLRDQMFLPEYLMYHLDNARLAESPLVSKTNLLLNYEDRVESRNERSWLCPELICILILLGELVLFLRPGILSQKTINRYDGTWWILLAVGSFVILFMWFATDHIATKYNLNLIWMNPLYLAMFGKGRKNKWAMFLALLLILALVQQFFIQSLHVASMLLILSLFVKLLRKLKAV